MLQISPFNILEMLLMRYNFFIMFFRMNAHPNIIFMFNFYSFFIINVMLHCVIMHFFDFLFISFLLFFLQFSFGKCECVRQESRLPLMVWRGESLLYLRNVYSTLHCMHIVWNGWEIENLSMISHYVSHSIGAFRQ